MKKNRNLDRIDFALDELPGEEMHEALHQFRAEGPIRPTKFLGLPAFIITGHQTLVDAFADNKTFPPHRMYQASFEGAIGESFISMADPRRHSLYRKLATPAFRSRAVSRYENEDLEPLARELVDRLTGQEEFDLVEAFTTRFPYLVISRLLGLPRDREDEFQDWAFALLRFRDDPGAAAEAREQLTAFLAPVVDDRRKNPRDDVISELVQARVDDRVLSDEEVYSHIRLLFPTGGETTHGALGNLLSLLLDSDHLWKTLCEKPSLAKAAIHETLRLETPIAVLPRLSAPVETEFCGVTLPADSWVLFAMAGANRDPSLYADPDRFDLERGVDESLTFGRGVKACPGMHLARKNMEVALQVLLERLPNIKLIDSNAAKPRRTVLRCPLALHVRATEASEGR